VTKTIVESEARSYSNFMKLLHFLEKNYLSNIF